MKREKRQSFMFKNWQKVAPQIVAASSASWAFLCTGLVRGWSAPSMPILTTPTNETIYLEADAAAWMTSLPPLCAVVGSLMISWPMQAYGRKLTLVGTSVPFIVGFYLMGLSYYVNSTALLFFGRVITGLVTGASTPPAQIYVSECASPRVRGALGSFTATYLALGILIAYVIGAFVEWHILCFTLGSFPIVFGLIMLCMPETPSWLLSKSKDTKAKKVLQQLRGKHTDIEEEFKMIKSHIGEETEANADAVPATRSYSSVVTDASLVKPMLISIALMFFQQFSGINAVVFYSVTIFQLAGSSIDRFVSSISIGVVQLVCTLLSAFLVDRAGRRVLLMISGSLMAVSLAILGTFLYLKPTMDDDIADTLGWIPLGSLIMFVVAYSIGYGAVPFLVMGELFPLQYRHLMSTFATSFCLSCSFLVVRTFPDLSLSLGIYGVFSLYAGCSVIGVIFVVVFLPETKGRTLEEISNLFSPPVKQNTPVQPI